MASVEGAQYRQRPAPGEPAGPMGARLANSTFALILAGGRGSRLGPLTAWRAKPAVPFGGKFRIIDFTLSNCVNSGIRRVGICTQYKAQSLIRHVQRGWSFLDGRFNEFIELLPAQQRVTADWYRGTADAAYQNLDLLRRHAPEYVLILAGDHAYKMDYARMLADHAASNADMTIACLEVPVADATGLGVMEVDRDLRITGFEEKPARPKPVPGGNVALASMGVYVFNAPFLYEQLIRDSDDPRSKHDFGGDVIPHLIRRGYRVMAHRFAESCVNMIEGGTPYWRDVGTIDAYWEANLDLCQVTPELNLYDAQWPIWTYQEQLPPAKFVFDDDDRRGSAVDSLVSGGCIISGATVRRSLLFSSVRVNSYCTIEDSVIIGDVEIGRGAVVCRAVIDKHVRVPAGMKIGVDPEEDARRFHVTPRGVTLVTPDMLGEPAHHLR